MRCLSNVLLPQPLSPMITKISPWRTSKFSPRRTVFLLYPQSRLRTTIALVSFALISLRMRTCPKNRIHHDDEEDASDHGSRGGIADPVRAPLGPQASGATDAGHSGGKDQAFQQAHSQVRQSDRLPSLQQVSRFRHAQKTDADRQSARDAQ